MEHPAATGRLFALRRKALLAGIPLALVALVLLAWMLDSRAHAGEPLRGVQIVGRDVGGLRGDALDEAIAAAAEAYAEESVVIGTPDDDIEIALADIGFTVDVEATAARALDEGRDDALPLRPLRWLLSLTGSREAGVAADVDRATLRDLLAAEEEGRTEPTEPGIVGDAGEIAVVLGKDGEGLDADEIADAIVEAAAGGAVPITVEAEPQTLSPRFDEDDAEALAEEVEELTAQPLTVSAGERTADIPASTVRSWLRSEPGDDGLELALDSEAVLTGLRELFADATTQAQDARFDVQGGRPVILPGVAGRECCADAAVGYVLGAVKAGHGGPIDLPLTTVDPDQTTEDLEALGIVEEIGSFTTRHDCCQGRVTNIHRIADIVRGVVVQPGGRFSINEFVGRRTTENGFVTGGVIENGSFAESVGGGISQFATTMFNAAFFAGLDFAEYQSHSIYISRYPYGREATLSFPKPDLIIENTTPHGVLIWPTYTGTTITVTLYSTAYAKGAQTGQSETPVGVAGCKRVTTTRTRTYVDGRTATDNVHAVYRPAEGVQCDGPAPTTTTTAPPPPPAETTTTTAPPG